MKDIYVKFNEAQGGQAQVAGESRDEGVVTAQGGTPMHKAPWFEVNSWAHMIRQPKSATASTAGGHTSERCEHGEMLFTKDLDMTSPQLWLACSAGTTFKSVDIDFMRASGTTNRIRYLRIKLINVIVSSVTPSVVEEGLPSETFGLKYAAVEWEYTKQQLDGLKGAAQVARWNLATNTPSIDSRV
jgi:type VI secretion system secreted protein Hcp